MHSNVNASVQQSFINLLGEQTLASNICQRLPQDLVTSGLDDDDFQGTLLSELWEVGLQPIGPDSTWSEVAAHRFSHTRATRALPWGTLPVVSDWQTNRLMNAQNSANGATAASALSGSSSQCKPYT